MFAHFDTELNFIIEDLIYKLNSFLPNNIAIHNLFQVHPEAHARFHALSRAYVYRISLQKDVFNYEGSYYFKQHLDVAKMQKASKLLLGHRSEERRVGKESR